MELDERFSRLAKDPTYKKIAKKERKVKIDARFEKMFTDERFQTKFVTDKRGKVIDVGEVEDLHSFYDIDRNEKSDDQITANGDEKLESQTVVDEKLESRIIVDGKSEGQIVVDDKDDDITDGKKAKKKEKKKKKKKKGKLLASVTGKSPGKSLQLKNRASLIAKKKKNANLMCSNEEEKENEEETEEEENEKEEKEEEEDEKEEKEEEEDEKEVEAEDESISFDDIRGETFADSSDSDGNDDLDNEGEDIDGENIIHGWGEIDDNVKYIENAETQRLAVCNCDWDRIGANDLYILFNSFKPINGTINSVKIYPSEFGIERMKEEKSSGPKELVESAIQGDDEHEEGSQYHMEKLREYQLNRLKYYYAVVECDSIGTANAIYEELDGKEYEMSATRLDLRFIPSDTTFEREPKSVADGTTQLKNYEPLNYMNTALQQTTVRLTWDEMDTKRLQTTMRKFTKDDVENMDFKDYLASSSSEDEGEDLHSEIKTRPAEVEDQCVEAGEHEGNNKLENKENNKIGENEENNKIEIYKKLMQEIEAKENNNTNNEQDIEMSFGTGGGDGDKIANFNEIAVKNRSHQENEDTSDEESDIEDDDDDDVDGDDDHNDDDNDEENVSHMNGKDKDEGFNDPFFMHVSQPDKKSAKEKSKKKRKRHLNESEDELSEGEAKSKKELELLLLDESEDKKHFNLKTILEKEKTNKSKKKKKRGKDTKEEVDDFKINVSDPRFSALYSSHLYALDPSEPNFKHTKATDAIIEESQRQHKKTNIDISSSNTEEKLDSNLSVLLKSVKSKTELHKFKKERTKVKK